MTSREEEDAWREIVANYGERPALTDLPPDPLPDHPPDPLAGTPPEPEPFLEPEARFTPAPVEPRTGPDDDEGRFVPPDPPPVPRPRGPRLFAWLGVIGVPLLLVLTTILAVPLPDSGTAALVLWFLGGFLWLVSQLPRERDDPFDDGAVL